MCWLFSKLQIKRDLCRFLSISCTFCLLPIVVTYLRCFSHGNYYCHGWVGWHSLQFYPETIVVLATSNKRSASPVPAVERYHYTSKCLRVRLCISSWVEQAFLCSWDNKIELIHQGKLHGCSRTSLQHSRTATLQIVSPHVWHDAFLKRQIKEMLLVLLNEKDWLTE